MPRKQPPSKPPPRARKVQAKRKKPAPYWADAARKAEEGGLVDPGVYAGPFTGFDEIDPSIVDEDDTED